MQPGDTVFWHSDVVHAVENEHKGNGYSNLMYIAATVGCEKNSAYLAKQAPAFLSGKTLPDFDRQLVNYQLTQEATRDVIRGDAPRSRIVYAAAHVVCDPLADTSPVDSPSLDWDATLAFRHHLWSFGLRIAEATDTAQRGSGLDWQASK